MTSAALRLLSSMATRDVLAEILARFRRESASAVVAEASGGVEVAKRVRAGETVDVVVLARTAIDALIADDKLRSDLHAGRRGTDAARLHGFAAGRGCQTAPWHGASLKARGVLSGMRRPLAAALLLSSALCASRAPAAQDGVRLIGRWLPPDNAPTATYAGSQIELHFKQSSMLSADFKVSDSKGDQPLYVSVSVDGGGPRRVALARGPHADVVLASGLSAGPHVVVVRKDGEPYFGALQFSNPKLDVAGRWLPAATDRPVIEVIGDSDATGICVLGPDSPAYAVSIRNSEWAFEALSWVGLLEAGLKALGHPADLVDLAISGSKTGSEADTYDLAAPEYSDAPFGEYAPPGRPHASLVFLWGGGNDRHGGGDRARAARASSAGGARPEYGALSDFQKGVHDQLTKIFGRNPGVKVVLLQYTDPAIPDWTPAYREVESMFSEDERLRILALKVYDPKGGQDACKADPDGHPNVSLHASWAAQILSWMMSKEVFTQLDFPAGEQWSEP